MEHILFIKVELFLFCRQPHVYGDALKDLRNGGSHHHLFELFLTFFQIWSIIFHTRKLFFLVFHFEIFAWSTYRAINQRVQVQDEGNYVCFKYHFHAKNFKRVFYLQLQQIINEKIFFKRKKVSLIEIPKIFQTISLGQCNFV